jgi:eukaryotic-like serine/threonine-protein kinase
MALEAGHAFGNYRLVKLIGEGGFGEVYLVENPLIHRLAAVKVLLPDLARNTEVVWRFLNEARAASAIRHPNIVEVLDAGATNDGAPYILMEYLDGESLYKRLTDRIRLPLAEVLSIAEQACSALAAAHASGIVHRDLKPENLFLASPDDNKAGGEILKILDFGIAKIISGEANRDTMKTRAGLVMGSPAYMSPEQCTDTAQVDLRTDIYSLATILYQALAGRTPHEHRSPTQLMLLHLTATPPTLSELSIEVPTHVESAVMRALAREPNDRFATMDEFDSALHGEPVAEAAGRGVVTRMDEVPSSRAKSRPERTAILAAGSTTPAGRIAPARRRTPVPSPTTNTTFSSSAIQKVTEPETTAPSFRQLLLGRKPLVLGGAVVLCVAALTVGLVFRGRGSHSGRDGVRGQAPASQPMVSPAPAPRPDEIAIPELAQPSQKAPPVAPTPTAQEKDVPKTDTSVKAPEPERAEPRRQATKAPVAETTERPRRPAGKSVPKATPGSPKTGATPGDSGQVIKHVKF